MLHTVVVMVLIFKLVIDLVASFKEYVHVTG